MRIKNIDGFENYMITDDGRVFNKRTKRFQKLNTNNSKGKYHIVQLYKDGKYYWKLVHRLVAQAFIPNPDNLPEVNHKNITSTDNRVENLEWVDRYDNNMKDRTRILNPAKPVDMFDLQGNYIRSFKSIKRAAVYTNIYPSSISDVCNGKRKSAGGYKWRFKN